MALRRELFRRGLRYRVDLPVIDKRRRHDIVFTRARVIVEVRGCFWHACPVHGTTPKSNKSWWTEKLAANVLRDQDTEERCAQLGWTLIVVWEHEDPVEAANRIESVARDQGSATQT